MKKAFLVVAALFSLISVVTVQAAEKVSTLDEIVVSGEKLVTPTKQTSENVFTGSEITKKGIEIQGNQASTSIYEAIDILPGVNVESPDPYGLSAEQRFVRIRGVRGFLGSMTVEGVPNWGGNPMGPREYIYDTENFESIAVYKGAVPADFGTGVGARGGAIELKSRWPEDKFRFDLSQGIGSYKYSRTFLRLDSGKLPEINTGLSVSYSYTDADKWKGPGKLGPRNNFNAMIKQPINDKDSVKIWVNYNKLSQDLYRTLTYAETRNLGINHSKDFNERLTGIRAQDIFYYQHNRGDFTNTDVMSVVPVTVSDSFKLTLKPYYLKEGSSILGGVTSQGGMIQKRIRDIERYGMISQIDSDFSWAVASLGYGFESLNMSILTQNFHPVTYAFQGYGILTENNGNGFVQSPYVKVAGNIKKFDWQAGLKYFHYNDPGTKGYLTPAPTYAPVRATDLDRTSRTYDQLLPTIGLGYNFSESLNVYASYGKNFIRPYSYVPIITLYNTNRNTFQTAGITLNELFNGFNMEKSDNIELGTRFRKERFEIIPAFFYSKHENLLTTIFDRRVNLNYRQNIGEATGYGVDLMTNLFLSKDWTVFFNPTYTKLTYDQNLNFQGNILNSKGRQVADTPEFLFKTGIIYKYGPVEIVPMLKYLADRYGDVEHTEKIGDVVVADLNLKYTRKMKSIGDTLKISLQLQNLFDNKYISVVNASDDSRAGGTSYYAGAPFTVLLSVSFEY